MTQFAAGALVKARGREWVVLPESRPDLLVIRPLGGTNDEIAGIYLPLESVESATLPLPDPNKPGDFRSSRMLRDAVRLGFRSSAGPFRSFGRLGCEPRPYQIVPLLMALKLHPVRLLIADDVGIGKTVEALLIAHEMLSRGEIRRLAVLCPPHLAEQWQTEMSDKFHIEAEVVLPSTARKLERNCAVGQSLFDVYQHVVVSMDYIKSERRRDDFIRSCPEFVIVDEAHTCTYDESVRNSARQQRHLVIKRLTQDANRNLILVTATPHSGKEGAFRSLLSLINPTFADLPHDLAGEGNRKYRRQVAAQLVQRRRPDIRKYLDSETPFPVRLEAEQDPTYRLSHEYRELFDQVVKFATELVDVPEENRRRKRVRWWSAIALLRCLASSPQAAAATLRSRAGTADTDTEAVADELGRQMVLDQAEDADGEVPDTVPGSDLTEDDPRADADRRRLMNLAAMADALKPEHDNKLTGAAKLVKDLISEGYQPIVFCRFIQTADYVATYLKTALRGVEVDAVTGLLPPPVREERVNTLAKSKKRVLVCTDCLSEGINLQEHFNAVLHYDLAWNPTRHEQRDGRVDRYGQHKANVKIVTYYGEDNAIDGIVLDILIHKHRKIRGATGVSIPVPVDTEKVIEAIAQGLMLRQKSGARDQDILPFEEKEVKPRIHELDVAWRDAAEREKRSRSLFAQESIKPEEVSRELTAAREAVGAGVDLGDFVLRALKAHSAIISGSGPWTMNLTESPVAMRDAMLFHEYSSDGKTVNAQFDRPGIENTVYLTRTHPMVEGLASNIMDQSLDPLGETAAHRSGVILSRHVKHRVTLLLLRLRYHLTTRHGRGDAHLLAEDCRILAFSGSPQNAVWLDAAEAEKLLRLEPDANITPDRAATFIRRVTGEFDALKDQIESFAKQCAKELLDAHQRVRDSAETRSITHTIRPELPADVLGIYIYLPAGG